MNTKKTRKIGCDWFKVTLEVRKVRKIAGVAVSLKSALGPRGTRYFSQNFRGRAGWVAGRSRANNAKVNGNPNHARSLVFFFFTCGFLDRRHGPEDAPAQRTDVPRERSRERRAASASTNKSVKNRETRRRQVKISRLTSTLLCVTHDFCNADT